MAKLTVDQISQVCHEANSAYCKAIGDSALKSWDELEEGYKESTRIGVRFALQGTPPRAMHASWMKERQQNGWVYGPVLDRENHIHPNLVPYEQLPEVQRKKDELFLLIVSVLS